MKNYLILTILFLTLNDCTPKSDKKNVAYIKLQIVKTEKDFEKLAYQ